MVQMQELNASRDTVVVDVTERTLAGSAFGLADDNSEKRPFVQSTCFNIAILILIVLNTILLAIEHANQPGAWGGGVGACCARLSGLKRGR